MTDPTTALTSTEIAAIRHWIDSPANGIWSIMRERLQSLVATVAELERKVEKLREALKLALPMVRGYAAEHRVPINDEIVNSTEVILAVTAPQPTDATAERSKENEQ